MKNLIFNQHVQKARWLLILSMLLTLSVGEMKAATIFNCGIDVNDTWYKGTGTINSGNWLGSKTAFNGANLGALTSMTLGGQYDTWDNDQTDYCSWNGNNGIHILIKKGSTQIANFKLTCYHDSKDGNNNVWKTKGGTGSCSDSGSWGTYTVDISGYAAGNDYTIKATWTSPSSQSNNATASFTINPVVTFKANGGTGSDYTQRVTYNTNTALTSNTFTKTGYDFAGWATSADGNVVYANGANVKLTAHTNLFAKWTPKTTTITLNNQEATTAGTTEVTATYDEEMPAITPPTKTGYTFGGYWGAPGGSGPKLYNADGSSNATWLNTESTYTLYAAWSENKSTVTLVASPTGTGTFQVGGVTVTSTQAGVATTPAVTAVPAAGYSFSGWSITGGASISSTSDNPTTVTGGGAGTAATLTATFEEDLTNYTLQFGTRKAENSYGSVTAEDGSGNSLTSGTEYLSGTSVTLTAAADDDYKFVSWYPGWQTGDPVSTDNPLTFTLTADTKRYAHFELKTTSITLNKNGGSGGTTGPVTATHGSTTLSTNPIVCPRKTSYTFTGYWTESSGGTKVIDADGTLVASVSGYTKSGNKKWDYDDPTLTLYAQWAEPKYDVTVSISNPAAAAGDIACTAAGWVAGKSGTAQIGNATAVRLTVGASNAGYKWGRWVLTGGVTLVSGSLTDPSIEVKATATGTATYTYDEELETSWYIAGDAPGSTAGSPFSGWGTSGTRMYKKTGHSTEEIYYCTISVSTVATTDAHFPFKVYNQATDKYYQDNGGSGYWILKDANTVTLKNENDKPNMKFRPYIAGDYEFKVDNTGANPVLTVTWPVINQLRISAASPTDATNTNNFDLADQGSNNWSVSRTLNAKTTYTFKIVYDGAWYGKNSTALTRASASASGLSTSGGDMTITTDAAGSYTFTFNSSTKNLSVTYPAAYTVTFGKGTGGNTIGASATSAGGSFTSGDYVASGDVVTFSQTPATGYTFKGWYTTADGNTSAGVNGDNELTINGAKTVYAQYTPNDYTITLDKNTGSANGSVTATYNSSSTKSFTAVTKTGYVCTGYWTASSGGYKVVNIDGTLAPYSSNISTYLNTNGTWKKTTTTTLYAQWTPATYTITLDKNGGTSNGTATATYDSNKLTSITAPTKTGYHTVDGYYKEGGTTNKISDLSGNLQASTTYTNASSQWSSTSNQTLYAKWAANTYTIAFNANDANYVGEATGTTASIAATYGVSYTLTANGFSRAGYTFNGWNTNADGTSGTNYSNSQTGVSNLTATNGATVTLYAKWTGLTYTVSFNKGAGTCAVSSSTVTFGSPYSAGTGLSGSLPEVTPPSGSVFNGWYDAPTGGNKIDDETLVTTASDHTLYARYTQRDRVYFYNNLGWSDVYVTYDPRDWSDTYGTGNLGKIYHHMTQIAGTDVWYDDLPEAVLSDWKWFVAFNSTQLGTVGESGTWEWFNSGNAVYRHDFDSYATMFVPESAKTDNWGKNTKASPTTTYYSSSWTYDAAGGGHGENYRQNVGYWMRYNDEKSGYSITGTWDSWANSTSLKAAEQGATTFAVTKVLDANTTYEFLLYKEFTHNTYNHIFTNTTTMTSANCTNIEFTTTNAKYSTLETNHAKITTTVAGEYVFKLTTGTDGKLKMSVEYPMSTNDYRVLYTWNDGSSSHTHASEIIKGAASTEKTISVFVHKASDVTSRSLKIQQCTGISGVGVPTWTDRNTIDLTSVSESGVHNFIITQPATGYATGAYSEKYTGNYYIRTESADGGWDYYLNHTDNVMTRSDYSMTQTLSAPFSHYYCRYIESTSIDITYQIATDYSPCVSEVLVGDATIGGVGNTRLPAPANVRFSWNEQTNALRRAYLKSAQGDGNTRYLVMHGADNKVRNDDATGTTIAANPGQSLAANELLFADQGNWVYQVSLKVVPGAKVSLIANYNSADRYLVGGADSYETIVGGTGENLYGITAVYDFKTNRLLTAWTPSGDITEALTDVDLLLLRHGQDGATTITFGVGGSLSAQRVTGAIRFDYDEMFGHVANWTADSRPLLKYFISFPFDVNVSDVFGLNSPYGDAYIIQRYAGDERAAKGFFRGDGTTTFWEDMPHDGVMKANVGYCVILDNDYFNGNETGSIWQNKSAGSSVYLYFPSAGDVGGITATSKTITVPAQTCTIDRTYTNSGDKTLSHTITDSHWNMMGVPIFNTHRGEATSGTPGAIFVSPENDAINFRYFYSWNSANNKFSITSAVGYDFKSMHSYMVQYTGNVTFTGGTTPSSVAARRTPLEKKYTIDLQALDSNDEMINRTYVELREQACDTFALSEDVYMESNNLAINIYTYAGNYDVAANVLSVGNHVVPVGLDVRKTGTYSLSMPSEFSGSVYLIDQETGERTNLAISDVTIDLEKGTYDERFLLEINVDEEIVTDVEYTTGEGSLKDGKPHKFLQNGILYLLKDGVVYDAQGHLIK